MRQAMKVSDSLTLPKGIQTGYAGHPKSTYYHTVFNLDDGVMYYKTKDQFNWTEIKFSNVRFDGMKTFVTQ
ncbi:hypothetical protein JCM19236_3872 [Vibrio sp. JCM 19236]|nr:hypothetical protein JCM19236_3872 [Vibrio sp. JCM 19236]